MSAHVDFFERIGRQGFDPRLGHVRGSFDVESNGDRQHWRVVLRGPIGGHGDVDLMLHLQRLFPAGEPAPAENAPLHREEAP